MTTKALYLVTFLVTASSAQAQCIEPPILPDPGALVASGYSAADLRRHYLAYFNETENYLNCVNDAEFARLLDGVLPRALKVE